MNTISPCDGFTRALSCNYVFPLRAHSMDTRVLRHVIWIHFSCIWLSSHCYMRDGSLSASSASRTFYWLSTCFPACLWWKIRNWCKCAWYRDIFGRMDPPQNFIKLWSTYALQFLPFCKSQKFASASRIYWLRGYWDEKWVNYIKMHILYGIRLKCDENWFHSKKSFSFSM